MIVCNGCGLALAAVDRKCPQCSGRAVEKQTPFAGFLTPSQQRDSPDRWARSYTLQSTVSSPTKTGHFDISTDHASGSLARVYGTVLDPNVDRPICTLCNGQILPGSKLYIASRNLTAKCCVGSGMCRQCYSQHFQLGTCEECKGPILGEKEEGGRHIIGRHGVKWHAKCFTCQRCLKPLAGDDHCLLPSGQPSCMRCFALILEGPDSCHPPLGPSQPPQDSSRTQRLQLQKSRMTVNELTTSTKVATPGLTSGTNTAKHSGLHCPGCNKSVAKFEINVVPGPNDSRWHRSCLRCGRGGSFLGCQKQLDLAATMHDDGTVLCRNCVMQRSSADDHRCNGPRLTITDAT